MFQIGKTLVSEEIIEEHFICDLSACKGACCVEGEAGAPLTTEEAHTLENNLEALRPFLSSQGWEEIKKQGAFITTNAGDIETPLIDGAACVYTTFNEQGVAQCGIEKANNQQAITFEKPISCHLYPVRAQNFTAFVAVNYHKWSICDAACSLGKELQQPIYVFVKNALIRKFGQHWFDELEQVAKTYPKQERKK